MTLYEMMIQGIGTTGESGRGGLIQRALDEKKLNRLERCRLCARHGYDNGQFRLLLRLCQEDVITGEQGKAWIKKLAAEDIQSRNLADNALLELERMIAEDDAWKRKVKSDWGSVENMDAFFRKFERASKQERFEMVHTIFSDKKSPE